MKLLRPVLFCDDALVKEQELQRKGYKVVRERLSVFSLVSSPTWYSPMDRMHRSAVLPRSVDTFGF